MLKHRNRQMKECCSVFKTQLGSGLIWSCGCVVLWMYPLLWAQIPHCSLQLLPFFFFFLHTAFCFAKEVSHMSLFWLQDVIHTPFFSWFAPYPVFIIYTCSWGWCVDLSFSELALLVAHSVLFEDLLDFPVSWARARFVCCSANVCVFVCARMNLGYWSD